MYYTDKTLLFPFHTQAAENPLFIEIAGIEQCAPSYIIRRQHSTLSVLGYVARGEGVISDKQGLIEVPTGSVFILEKHKNHEYWANPKDPWQILWFNVDGELFLTLTSQYRLTERVYPNVGDEIAALFENALVPCIGRTDLDSMQQTLNEAIFAILSRLAAAQVTAGFSGKCTEIRRYLEQYANPPRLREFSLQQMEKALHISLRQINRIFLKEVGVTPYEYIMERKAELAGQYLLSTALSIKEISSELGFSDPYYFSNFFKKRFGLSPKQYRQLQNR